MEKLIITTPAGEMPVYFFPKSDDAPLVVLLMDAIGVRDELKSLARDIQALGYNVALPSLYYREGHYEDMDFGDPEVHAKVMQLYGSLTHEMVREDIAALLSAMEQRPVGLLGFCMGGANALIMAGSFPDDIAVAVAVHPGGITTHAKDSPHRIAARAKGKLYIAIADEDPYATADQVAALEASLKLGDVDYTLEVYEGAHHGFAFASLPSFNAQAQERYWQATCRAFNEALG
ncbi:dienelactone hydrolase family protein [Litorivivens sp.]|uniref:dienelactone hydrolase family protein n=1 Tax=Litorivivens sp. TaxID=2020868 RepID=UPI0035660D7E